MRREVDWRCISYYNERGFLHREDGPARIFHWGGELWYIDGVLERKDGGPPIIEADGSCFSWGEGGSKPYSYEEKDTK